MVSVAQDVPWLASGVYRTRAGGCTFVSTVRIGEAVPTGAVTGPARWEGEGGRHGR